jgi:Cu+-exporting ATPase
MATRSDPSEYPEPEDLSLVVNDPVCGREVAITRAAASEDYAGTTYYFCSLQCQQDFERQPDRYVPSPEGEL